MWDDSYVPKKVLVFFKLGNNKSDVCFKVSQIKYIYMYVCVCAHVYIYVREKAILKEISTDSKMGMAKETYHILA